MRETNSLTAENKKLKELMTNNAKAQAFAEYLGDIKENIEDQKTTIELLAEAKKTTESQLDQLKVSFQTLRGKNTSIHGRKKVLKAL